MWNKIATVMGLVSKIRKEWWFNPLIGVFTFTVLAFFLWVLSSQTKPTETSAAVVNSTKPPSTAAVPTTASYPPTCIGMYEGEDAFDQAKENCEEVNFRVLWTSPRDWHGCVFNSNKVPSDFGSQDVLESQKLVIWVPHQDEKLYDKPNCHSRVGKPSSGGSVHVNSTTECRGMFEGNDALEIARC
jgi:hypothetical protein